MCNASIISIKVNFLNLLYYSYIQFLLSYQRLRGHHPSFWSCILPVLQTSESCFKITTISSFTINDNFLVWFLETFKYYILLQNYSLLIVSGLLCFVLALLQQTTAQQCK